MRMDAFSMVSDRTMTVKLKNGVKGCAKFHRKDQSAEVYEKHYHLQKKEDVTYQDIQENIRL
eukprot:15365363-Ditylum_brightwellii.AAC.2